MVKLGQDIIHCRFLRAVGTSEHRCSRFIVTALCQNQIEGKPFFVVSPNQLNDPFYLEYLRQMYGSKIGIRPVDQQNQALQISFGCAATKAARSGETGRNGSNQRIWNRCIPMGRVPDGVRGYVLWYLMQKNPTREFYYETLSRQSSGTYSYLEPHGLIMKLNRARCRINRGNGETRHRFFGASNISPFIGDC